MTDYSRWTCICGIVNIAEQKRCLCGRWYQVSPGRYKDTAMHTLESRYIVVNLDSKKIAGGRSEGHFEYQNGSIPMRLLNVRLTRLTTSYYLYDEIAYGLWAQDPKLDIDHVMIGNENLMAFSRNHPILNLGVKLQVIVKNHGDVELMTGVELVFIGSL